MKVGASRTIGPPRDAKSSEAHGIQIHTQHPSGKRSADPGEQFDHLDGSDASCSSRDRTKNWEASLPIGWVFGDQALEAGGDAGNEGRDLRMHRVHRALYHRFSRGHRRAVEGEAFLEKRGCIHNDVAQGHQTICVLGRHVLGDPSDLNPRIQSVDLLGDTIHARLTAMVM